MDKSIGMTASPNFTIRLGYERNPSTSRLNLNGIHAPVAPLACQGRYDLSFIPVSASWLWWRLLCFPLSTVALPPLISNKLACISGQHPFRIHRLFTIHRADRWQGCISGANTMHSTVAKGFASEPQCSTAAIIFSRRQVLEFTPYIQKGVDRLCHQLNNAYKVAFNAVKLNDTLSALATNNIIFHFLHYRDVSINCQVFFLNPKASKVTCCL